MFHTLLKTRSVVRRELIPHFKYAPIHQNVNRIAQFTLFRGNSLLNLRFYSTSLEQFNPIITPAIREKLKGLESRYAQVTNILQDEKTRTLYTSDAINKLFKESTDLNTITDNIKLWDSKVNELSELSKILWSKEEVDPELYKMAEDDYSLATQEIEPLEKQIISYLLPKDNTDDKSVIIELRPGTGGSEASLFAMDMLEMYKNFATLKGWEFEVLELALNDIGGIRDATLNITGSGAFGVLKYESGVHRVQRVPQTETMGRVHTSTMTVAVLPEAEEVDVKLDEKDLRIDTYRASGNGGQSVNKTESAIRIVHIPTGITVTMQDERSQHRNKAKAMKILMTRVHEREKEKLNSERNAQRTSQTGSGNRNERIRTYNFSQDRVTDHRCGYSTHGIWGMMQGQKLDNFAEAMQQMEQDAQLKALNLS